jgi:hypothetical protein
MSFGLSPGNEVRREPVAEVVSPEILARFMATLKEGEEKLSGLFAQLPKDLVVFWVDIFNKNKDNLSLQEKIAQLKYFVASREVFRKKELLNPDSVYAGFSPEIREAMMDTVFFLSSEGSKHFKELGKGQYARVCEDPRTSSVAIKYPFNQEAISSHRHMIKQEVQYMEEMQGFTVDAVRAPHLFAMRTNSPPYFIVMEKVKGFSGQDIIDRKCPDDFLQRVRKSSEASTAKRIENFLRSVHTEKRIVHGDIHPGNIMFDMSGNIFIIDFGKTVSMPEGVDPFKEVNPNLLAYEGVKTFTEAQNKELQLAREAVSAVYNVPLHQDR